MKHKLATMLIVMAVIVTPRGDAAQDIGNPAAGPAVGAVWVERELRINYMAFTSFYSCDGLRAKVRWVLEELGARPGFTVHTRGCSNISGPELMPAVEVVAALPVEATPEVLAEIASGATRRELQARATGRSTPESDAPAQFAAQTRRDEFRSRPNGAIEDGDCELIEQLRDHLMVPLGVRVVEDSLSCVPRQVSMGAVRLAVEVLQPVPEP